MNKYLVFCILLITALLLPASSYAQQPVAGTACGTPGLSAIATNGQAVQCEGQGGALVWVSKSGGGGGGGAPTGPAGGDLSGAYPNPAVSQLNGGVVPTSALVLGTDAAKKPVAATAANVASLIQGLPGCNTASNVFTPQASDCVTIGGSGTVTSVGLTVPAWLAVVGSPITGAGTLAVSAATGQTPHQVIGTCGSATTFAPCALVAADLPSGTATAGSLTTGFEPQASGPSSLVNSTCDHGVTTANTFTCSDTAGAAFSGPVKISGSGAGADALAQGTANSAVANSVGWQAPTSVTTPYFASLPGTIPTSGNTILSCTATNPPICSWVAGGGGSGTVTSIATTSPISGGTITTSGTISCPTCATASAPTSGFVPKWSGTAGLEVNSLCDEAITTANTLTCSDTAGIAAPKFISTGTTAGFVDYPQGSTSAAVAPCNTANSICEQAPAAVTAYVLNKPGVAPVNNNSAQVYSNASPGVGAWAKMPQTAFLTGSAYTNATTGFTSVTGLSFSVEASTNYYMTCQLTWQASASTGGLKVQITGPASPTAVAINYTQTATTSATVAATFTSESATAFSTSLSDTLSVTTATNMPSVLTMGLVNGANAGTVQVQAAADGAGTVTIQPGSSCQLQ